MADTTADATPPLDEFPPLSISQNPKEKTSAAQPPLGAAASVSLTQIGVPSGMGTVRVDVPKAAPNIHQGTPIPEKTGDSDGPRVKGHMVGSDLDVSSFALAKDGSVGGCVDMAHSKPDLQPQSSPHVQEPRSYTSIFKDATNSLKQANISKQGKLRFIAPKVTDSGIKQAVIPRELIVKQAESWSSTLVGYFIGKRPAFPFVKFHANRLWKRFELDDVILNNHGYFYFKFKNEHGLKHVFENGPWLFNDIPILLKRWQPDCWFDKPVPTKVSLWVNIYDMPADLWNYEIMSHIVSTIGVPIAVDRYTAEMCEKETGRAVFARVLVELSADEEVPMFAEANIMDTVRRFRLQYNWIPPRCLHCNIFGHKFDDCSVRPRTSSELEARMVNAAKPREVALSGVKDDEFHQPKRRRRRIKKVQFDKALVGPQTHIDSSPSTDNPSSISTVEVRNQFQGLETETLNNVEVNIPSISPDDPDPVDRPEKLDNGTQDQQGPESSVVSPSTPPAMKDLSNPSNATDYNSSWLDYVSPPTNEELESANIWYYKDPSGESHGPFSLTQLYKWSEYLPIDLKIWRISGTKKESTHLCSALKRRGAGLKNSNVG